MSPDPRAGRGYSRAIGTTAFPLLSTTFTLLRNGSGDPTTVVTGDSLVRVSLDRNGPTVTRVALGESGRLRVAVGTDPADSVEVDDHPLAGGEDAGHRLVAAHPAVSRAMSRFGRLRLPSSGNPYHELLPAVLGQRVTAGEGLTQWRLLCEGWGQPVRVDGRVLHAPPEPDILAAVPYYRLHGLGIDRRRAEALRAVARHGARLLSGWPDGEGPASLSSKLRLIPGVGEWTAATAGLVAFADPDALDVGDYHTRHMVVYALTGRHRGSDDEMCDLLSAYPGERGRVALWLALDGWRAPAHGPRRRILPVASL